MSITHCPTCGRPTSLTGSCPSHPGIDWHTPMGPKGGGTWEQARERWKKEAEAMSEPRSPAMTTPEPQSDSLVDRLRERAMATPADAIGVMVPDLLFLLDRLAAAEARVGEAERERDSAQADLALVRQFHAQSVADSEHWESKALSAQAALAEMRALLLRCEPCIADTVGTRISVYGDDNQAPLVKWRALLRDARAALRAPDARAQGEG